MRKGSTIQKEHSTFSGTNRQSILVLSGSFFLFFFYIKSTDSMNSKTNSSSYVRCLGVIICNEHWWPPDIQTLEIALYRAIYSILCASVQSSPPLRLHLLLPEATTTGCRSFPWHSTGIMQALPSMPANPAMVTGTISVLLRLAASLTDNLSMSI